MACGRPTARLIYLSSWGPAGHSVRRSVQTAQGWRGNSAENQTLGMGQFSGSEHQQGMEPSEAEESEAQPVGQGHFAVLGILARHRQVSQDPENKPE